MRHIGNRPFALFVWRIILLYIVLALCRVVFYCYNFSQIGTTTTSELWPLLCGSLKFDTVSILYANLPFILLALLPLHLRERRWYRDMMFWLYTVVNSLLIVVPNLADTIYFRYTQKRFTSDEIFFADNSNSAQLVWKFAVENWYVVLFGIAMIGLLTVGYRRNARSVTSRAKATVYYPLNLLILVVALLLSIVGIRGGATRMTRPITLSNAMFYTDNNIKANLILSNPFCIIRTIGNSDNVNYEKWFDTPKLDSLYSPYHRPEQVGVYEGYNVVIFIMESMSAENSAYLRGDLYTDSKQKGYTPFLDSLMRNSLCFKRMYANGTRSIQAMPSVLGSIPSFKEPFVLMPQSLGESRQLPAMLRDKGYSTHFFCGSEAGSMGFGAYARSAGVEQLYSREDYEKVHGKADFDGYWGIWDDKFMQFMGERLTQEQEPFMAAMFTLSSHHPFVTPDQYRGQLPAGETKLQPCVAYEDLAYRKFFAEIADTEWYPHTIFIFVADHVSSERFAPETAHFPASHHIFGFIYTPDGSLARDCEEIVAQVDIMPTVLGLLGNRTPYFAFGRDVLNEPERPEWCVVYENEFKALTNDRIITSDKSDTLKAMIQQYYTHIEQKSYIVK